MITSNGQLQMPPGQLQLLTGNIMLTPQGMPGGMQVSMAGPPGQAPMMKANDGKPVPPGQQQMQGQPQLIAMPGGGMAYMHPGPQQFMQNKPFTKWSMRTGTLRIPINPQLLAKNPPAPSL